MKRKTKSELERENTDLRIEIERLKARAEAFETLAGCLQFAFRSIPTVNPAPIQVVPMAPLPAFEPYRWTIGEVTCHNGPTVNLSGVDQSIRFAQ